MKDQKTEQLRRRFNGGNGDKADVVRRRDFKGSRKGLHLRLPIGLLENLQLLRAVSGIDTTTFCVEAIKAATQEKLAQVRGEYDAAEWQIVRKCAGLDPEVDD